MNIGWEITKIILYLALVVGLIYLLNYFLKKNITINSKGKYIKVIERVYLSPKKGLTLITVHDTVLLISNDDNQLRVLQRWDKKDFPDLEDQATNSPTFKEYWQQFLTNNRRGKND